MPTNPIDVADRLVGQGIERLTREHHARRLRRIGRGEQRSPPDDGQVWAAGEPPPRDGCSLEVLIDGAAYFSALERAIRGARRTVHIAGWTLSPGFALARDEPPVLLRELLAEAAETADVRVLLWAGAPVPVSEPRRASVRAMRDELVRGTRIQVALDTRERPLHCHHEKLAVIDDELAFVGGIDLTDLDGDRYDTPSHPGRGRMGWHDVAARLRGPVVSDVGRHFAQRWHAVTGEDLPAPPPSPPPLTDPAHQVQLVRTVPEKLYDFAPRGDFRIIEGYVRALRSARSLVYLENQFLWSPEIVNILADKLRRPPTAEFRLVIMLPGKPNIGEDDTQGQLATLTEADAGCGRFLATTLRALSGRTSDRVYIHAKLAIVDDRWLTLGSANLNAHSFYNDSEVNIITCDPTAVRDTRLRLWATHLDHDIEDVAGPPHTIVDQLWRPIAAEQRDRRHRGEPLTHKLVELPATSRRAKRLLGPLQSLAVDG